MGTATAGTVAPGSTPDLFRGRRDRKVSKVFRAAQARREARALPDRRVFREQPGPLEPPGRRAAQARRAARVRPVQPGCRAQLARRERRD